MNATVVQIAARTFGEFNRQVSRGMLAYGPWSPTCDRIERGKQLRSLAALVAAHYGSEHPLVSELRAAETDPMAFVRAQEAFERLPSLTRRKVLSTFSAITRPIRTPIDE